MSVCLDLSVYEFKHERGDITIYGTWYGESLDESEPVLCLVPTYRKLVDGQALRAQPCCVALSSAHKYDEPDYMLAAAREISALMGFEDTMNRTHKIATMIHDHLLDLIKMPPRPVMGSHTQAEGSVTNRATGETRTFALTKEY